MFFCGTKSTSFLGPEIWNIDYNEFKKETSLNIFKKVMKSVNLKTVHGDYVNHTYKFSDLFTIPGTCFLSTVCCIEYDFCHCNFF